MLSLDEIIGLRWQCNNCGTAISFKMDQSINLPQKCGCGMPLTDAASFTEFQQMQGFVIALKTAIGAHRSKRLGATLQVELDGPV